MEFQRKMQFSMMSQTNNTMDVGNFQQLSIDIDTVLKNSRSDLIPVAYNRDFSMSEKFIDAIQLKVFISKNCTNVTMLERVLKILMKMIKGHPDEVLKSDQEIWLMMVQMLLGLT